jgi:uncharacterized protein (DUF2147 family)
VSGFIKKIEAGATLLTVLVCILSAFSPAIAIAFEADNILGQWFTTDGDAIIEFYRCDSKYCGRIIWSRDPNYPPNDEMGMGGQPRVDRFNPDPRLRSRPIVGLTILKDFTFSGGNLWKDGTVYNPDNGKTYKCKLTLISKDRLEVKGYIGIPLFGKTSVWTRNLAYRNILGSRNEGHGPTIHD